MYDQYGFNPYNQYQQPMMQRPMMNQPIPQPAPQQMQQSGPWAIVQTISQVEQVAVQPGQVAWIMVQNEPVFARREADRMGLISTEYCRFERFDPKAAAQAAPAVEYVTKAEFDRFVADMRKELGINE